MNELLRVTHADLTRDVVRCVVHSVLGADVADNEPIFSYSHGDLVNVRTVLIWRLEDALFVKLPNDEIDKNTSVVDLAALASARQPGTPKENSPTHLFELVRAAVQGLAGSQKSHVTWDTSLRWVVRSACSAKWSLHLADWGYSDLLGKIDEIDDTRSDFTGLIMRRGVRPLPVLEALDRWDASSAVVNYLWRLKHSKDERLMPRIPWHHAKGTGVCSTAPKVELALTRLLVVMGLAKDPRVDRTARLESLFRAASLQRGAAGPFVRPWGWLLDFELRATFGVNIHPLLHRFAFGNLTGFKLPRGLQTFGDLCDRVNVALGG